MKNVICIPIPDSTKELLRLFLQEKFAEKHKFEQNTLGEIGTLLETELSTVLEPEFEESAKNTQALYCLILQDLELNNIEELPNRTVGQILNPSTNGPSAIHSEKGKNYFALYDFLSQVSETSLPVPKPYAHKVTTQFFCFSIEAEIDARFAGALQRWWPERAAWVKPLLEVAPGKLSLHSDLVQLISKWEEQFPQWSSGGNARDPLYTNLLRYVLQFEESHLFKPNLAEAGILLFFFGGAEALTTISLQNLLGVEGLSKDERIELGFRLLRLHKVKMKSVSVSAEFDDAFWEMLNTDKDRVLELLGKLNFEVQDKDKLSEVA